MIIRDFSLTSRGFPTFARKIDVFCLWSLPGSNLSTESLHTSCRSCPHKSLHLCLKKVCFSGTRSYYMVYQTRPCTTLRAWWRGSQYGGHNLKLRPVCLNCSVVFFGLRVGRQLGLNAELTAKAMSWQHSLCKQASLHFKRQINSLPETGFEPKTLDSKLGTIA